MKQLIRITALAIGVFFFMSENVSAQDKSKRPSPPDQVNGKMGNAEVTIDYSQPSVKGREIFGGLEKYGVVWRTGANENTWIEISTDVTVQGEKLAKGKYGFFTIPGENEWTIIFNSKSDGWGAYSYSEADDVLRVKVKPMKNEHTEKFTISIEGTTVKLAWDKTKVEFEIKG